MSARTGHVSFHLDPATLAALDAACREDERNKSDWLRVLIRRELRQRGLLGDKRRRADARKERAA